MIGANGVLVVVPPALLVWVLVAKPDIYNAFSRHIKGSLYPYFFSTRHPRRPVIRTAEQPLALANFSSSLSQEKPSERFSAPAEIVTQIFRLVANTSTLITADPRNPPPLCMTHNVERRLPR